MKELSKKVEELLKKFKKSGLKLVTAESCTGGMISSVITDVSGSSDVFERGFVTYSNEAKNELLGVSTGLLEKHGAVSEEVAKAMAEGALSHSRADISIAVTGVAGPGASENKPAGLVYIASAKKAGETICCKNNFTGDRDKVRKSSVSKALDLALKQAE